VTNAMMRPTLLHVPAAVESISMIISPPINNHFRVDQVPCSGSDS